MFAEKGLSAGYERDKEFKHGYILPPSLQRLVAKLEQVVAIG